MDPFQSTFPSSKVSCNVFPLVRYSTNESEVTHLRIKPLPTPSPPPPKRKILPTPLKKFLRMSCAVDWEQFRASVQYQNFIVSCFPYHFRVRQITFSARIRLNHLGVVRILRKARITHRIKILSRLSKILSAIPLVLIHLVSLFITYSVSFSLSYLNDVLMYVL